MVTVELGNGYYFLFIGLAILLIVAGYFLLKNKSYKFKYNTLLIILFLNLALHFIKMAFEPARSNLPGAWRNVTFDNICASSTLVFPFLFLQKKYKFLHDYMFFIGCCGGIAALAYPTGALGNSPIVFESLRFYFCHTVLIGVPMLSAMLGIHKPRLSLKRFWVIPTCFLVHETVILLNEIFLVKVGLVETDLANFLSAGGERNASFVFGPWPKFSGFAKVLTIFTPSFMCKDIFMINGGVDFYWPVLWMVFPVFIYFPILNAILSCPFWLPEFIKSKKKTKETKEIVSNEEVTDTTV